MAVACLEKMQKLTPLAETLAPGGYLRPGFTGYFFISFILSAMISCDADRVSFLRLK
jgi:hypothetical protein